MMKNYRANPLKELAGSEVVLVKDFDSLEATDMKTGKKTKLDMPATSNVLQYFTEDGTKDEAKDGREDTDTNHDIS